MKTSLEMVREFHEAFAPEQTHDFPHVTDPRLNELRMRLLGEELLELCEALKAGDPVKTLDALCDLQYVLDGAFLALGFASVKDAAMAEVHRANTEKYWNDFEVWGIADERKAALSLFETDRGYIARDRHGKVIKPPSHQPPNLAQFLPCQTSSNTASAAQSAVSAS
jgi:hypothetical protein